MTLDVAVIGAGKMGRHHARVFARHARLLGAFDVVGARAATLAGSFGGEVLDSIDVVVATADLVVVATPTAMHFEHAKRALEAGCHVLVEKPLCHVASEAWALCELARARGVELFVGHSERFNPVVRDVARAVVDTGVSRVVTRRILANTDRDDEPCLNLAVHDIDLAAFLSGCPAELVSARGEGRQAEVALTLGAVEARITVGYGRSAERALHIQTPHGTYGGDLTRSWLAEEEPLSLQARAVLEALAGTPTDVATGIDGARSVAVALRAASLLAEAVSAAE
jgi:predicted dehydrogenase